MLTHANAQAEPVSGCPPSYKFNLTLVFPKRTRYCLPLQRQLERRRYSLCSPGWPQILGQPPASASPVQGITGMHHHAQQKGNIYLNEAEFIKNLTPEKPSNVISNIAALERQLFKA